MKKLILMIILLLPAIDVRVWAEVMDPAAFGYVPGPAAFYVSWAPGNPLPFFFLLTLLYAFWNRKK